MTTTPLRYPSAAAAAHQKTRDRAMWAAGDWPAVARLVGEAGARVVERAGVRPGDDVLDIGCGTGNAAIPAAARGARAVGLDLTPELLAAGRADARAAGVEVEFVEGDAEALPFADASFDVVVSTFGCMFAPRHDVAAREAARVLRPGGRLAVFAWTPEGAAGELFRVLGEHLAAAGTPPAAGPPPTLWGVEAHVTGLFAGTGVELTFDRGILELPAGSVARMVEIYERDFGPIVLARRALEPIGAWPALRADLEALIARHAGRAGAVFASEYLVIDGTRPPMT